MADTTTALRGAIIAAAIALTLGTTASATAQTAPRSPAVTVLVGPATGDPEKDTVGFVLSERGACGLVPQFSATPERVGEATGDPEKDDIGFVVVGHEGCAALAAGDMPAR